MWGQGQDNFHCNQKSFPSQCLFIQTFEPLFHCTKVNTVCVLNPLRYTWGYDSCFFPDCFNWFTQMASCISKLFLFLKNQFVFFKGIKTHFERFLVRFLFSLNKNRDPLFLSLSIRQTDVFGIHKLEYLRSCPFPPNLFGSSRTGEFPVLPPVLKSGVYLFH